MPRQTWVSLKPLSPIAGHRRELVLAHSCENRDSSNRFLELHDCHQPGQTFLETALQSEILSTHRLCSPSSFTGVGAASWSEGSLPAPASSPLSFTSVSTSKSLAHQIPPWNPLLEGPEFTQCV